MNKRLKCINVQNIHKVGTFVLCHIAMVLFPDNNPS